MPRILTGKNIFLILKDFPNDFEKEQIKGKSKKRKIDDSSEDEDNEDDNSVKKELSRWKKRSIFFDLPYWEVSIQISFLFINLKKRIYRKFKCYFFP